MALTRKFLTALGIEADKIDQIIEAHADSVDALKKYKEDAEKLPEVQGELDKLKAEVEKNGTYKEKYDKEHAEFEAYKGEQTAKETRAKKQEAYKKLLAEAGISEKHLNQLLKASTSAADAIEFDDKGVVKDSDKIVESIKSEWPDFVTIQETRGVQTPNPPKNNGGGKLSADAEYARARFAQQYAEKYGADPNKNADNGGNE